jgi:hypothetical protein
MTSEFPPNSQRPIRPIPSKAEPKKVEQVVTGEVIRRKKPLSRRFAEIFVGQNPRSAATFVAFDVLIPAAKDAFADAISQGFERIIFGEARSSSRRAGGYRPSNVPGHTSYNRYSSSGPMRPQNEPRQELSRRARASHDFGEIILPTRVEADEVIDHLCNIVEKYEVATVADLYDLIGIEGAYTDDNWGWTDLRDAGVQRIRNGYLLNLPRPEPIDKR